MEENALEQITKKDESLDDKLVRLLDEWLSTIEEMNSKMKNLPLLDELLTDVYTKRQKAVDLYFGMMKVLANQTRSYKYKYAGIYNGIKSGQNNIRYTNETAILTLVESQLVSEKEVIDSITNFTNYMKETIQTIDNIIYGINNKIKLHEILNGMKF